jgi:hypothetical protein
MTLLAPAPSTRRRRRRLVRALASVSARALAVTFAAAAGLAAAQDGLNLKPAPPAEQKLQLGPVQLGLLVSLPGSSPRAQLFGDYYLTGPGFGQGDIAGGLRLTSGLAIGPRRATQGLPPVRLGEGLRSAPGLQLGPDLENSRVALPYLGLGYTSLSAREGWGFSADIGLGGLAPGERLRLGRGNPTAAQVENVLNALRLAPVLQLGVSYAF